MNIKILTNLILITLAVININTSDNGKKRRASDDSNLDPKRIKLDPSFLAELAKAKVLAEKNKEDKSKEKVPDPAQKDLLAKIKSGDEKVIINLDATKLPRVLQQLIAEYFKGEDWYLYFLLDLGDTKFIDCYMEKIHFSNDNNLILFGGITSENSWWTKNPKRIEMLEVFNIDNKSLEKFNFTHLVPESMYKQQFQFKKIQEVKEDILGKYNIIEFTDLDTKKYYLNKTYFSIDMIRKGLFSFSLDRKYLAYACINFFKIWNISKIAGIGGELNEGNIIKTYNLNPNNDDRDEDDNNSMNNLSFSDCGNYLAIIGTCGYGNEAICFIYDLANKSILDLSKTFECGPPEYGLRFSHDSKYMALGGIGRLYILKKRQLLLEE